MTVRRPRLFRRFLPALLALPLAAAMFVPASANAATTPTAPAGSVVYGTVSTSSGVPLAGTPVLLYAWPSQSVTASIKIGQQVPRTLLGTAVTSSTGTYSITPANVSALAASASSSGIVNLEVDAYYQKKEAAFFFPRQLVTSGSGMALAVPSQASIAQLTPQAANLTIRGVQAPAAGTPQASPSPDFFGCAGSTPTATWNNQGVNLGGEWSYVDSVWMNFTYEAGSSSTLGVALNQAGVGGWTASGTYTIGAGSVQNWPQENVRNGYNRKSNFTYTEYVDSCGNHQTHVTNWDGGNPTTIVGFLPAGNCEPEQVTAPKPTLILNNTVAWTYSTGVSIADKIGINLSAQTGYTQTASESYTFTDTAHQRYLCGKTGPPNGTNPGPGYVVAGTSAHGGS